METLGRALSKDDTQALFESLAASGKDMQLLHVLFYRADAARVEGGILGMTLYLKDLLAKVLASAKKSGLLGEERTPQKDLALVALWQSAIGGEHFPG